MTTRRYTNPRFPYLYLITTRFPMSLWTFVRWGRAQKRKTAVFRVKSYFVWRKSATKWGDDSRSKCVVTYANSLTSVRRLAVAKRTGDCSYLIFAPSASAVTPSASSWINTNRKSTTSFQMSLRWTLYVAPKTPKGGSKTQSVWNKVDVLHVRLYGGVKRPHPTIHSRHVYKTIMLRLQNTRYVYTVSGKKVPLYFLP